MPVGGIEGSGYVLRQVGEEIKAQKLTWGVRIARLFHRKQFIEGSELWRIDKAVNEIVTNYSLSQEQKQKQLTKLSLQLETVASYIPNEASELSALSKKIETIAKSYMFWESNTAVHAYNYLLPRLDVQKLEDEKYWQTLRENAYLKNLTKIEKLALAHSLVDYFVQTKVGPLRSELQEEAFKEEKCLEHLEELQKTATAIQKIFSITNIGPDIHAIVLDPILKSKVMDRCVDKLLQPHAEKLLQKLGGPGEIVRLEDLTKLRHIKAVLSELGSEELSAKNSVWRKLEKRFSAAIDRMVERGSIYSFDRTLEKKPREHYQMSQKYEGADKDRINTWYNDLPDSKDLSTSWLRQMKATGITIGLNHIAYEDLKIPDNITERDKEVLVSWRIHQKLMDYYVGIVSPSEKDKLSDQVNRLLTVGTINYSSTEVVCAIGKFANLSIRGEDVARKVEFSWDKAANSLKLSSLRELKKSLPSAKAAEVPEVFSVYNAHTLPISDTSAWHEVVSVGTEDPEKSARGAQLRATAAQLEKELQAHPNGSAHCKELAVQLVGQYTDKPLRLDQLEEGEVQAAAGPLGKKFLEKFVLQTLIEASKELSIDPKYYPYIKMLSEQSQKTVFSFLIKKLVQSKANQLRQALNADPLDSDKCTSLVNDLSTNLKKIRLVAGNFKNRTSEVTHSLLEQVHISGATDDYVKKVLVPGVDTILGCLQKEQVQILPENITKLRHSAESVRGFLESEVPSESLASHVPAWGERQESFENVLMSIFSKETHITYTTASQPSQQPVLSSEYAGDDKDAINRWLSRSSFSQAIASNTYGRALDSGDVKINDETLSCVEIPKGLSKKDTSKEVMKKASLILTKKIRSQNPLWTDEKVESSVASMLKGLEDKVEFKDEHARVIINNESISFLLIPKDFSEPDKRIVTIRNLSKILLGKIWAQNPSLKQEDVEEMVARVLTGPAAEYGFFYELGAIFQLFEVSLSQTDTTYNFSTKENKVQCFKNSLLRLQDPVRREKIPHPLPISEIFTPLSGRELGWTNSVTLGPPTS